MATLTHAGNRGDMERAFRETALLECAVGDPAVVTEITGDSAVAARLREIGVVPGTRVCVVRKGFPMIVQLGNSRFCLRGTEAELVTVCVPTFTEVCARGRSAMGSA